jgi:fatty acid amide hydrolase 2
MAEAAETGYAELLGDGRPVAVGRELLRLAAGRSRHTAPALAVCAAEGVMRGLPGERRRLAEAGRALAAAVEEALGPRGVLLYPPYSRPAPRHGDPLRTPFDFVCTAIFNVLELPVTAVPMGFDARGLPLGVQVVARRGCDHLTIAAAQALEEAGGGWVRADPRKMG